MSIACYLEAMTDRVVVSDLSLEVELRKAGLYHGWEDTHKSIPKVIRATIVVPPEKRKDFKEAPKEVGSFRGTDVQEASVIETALNGCKVVIEYKVPNFSGTYKATFMISETKTEAEPNRFMIMGRQDSSEFPRYIYWKVHSADKKNSNGLTAEITITLPDYSLREIKKRSNIQSSLYFLKDRE